MDMKLIFNNPEKTYYSGETVSGRLVILSNESITLRKITLKFQGKAKTHWSDGDDSYWGTQKYFKKCMTLYEVRGKNEALPPGEYCYTFQMLLPEHIPSSFKSRDGHIRYKIKANIDRPLWPDSHVQEELKVISSVDLNSIPENKNPLTIERNASFCCCCCRSGPLTLVSKIDRRGYVAGDVITLVVEIDNASNVGVNRVSYELQRVIVCYTNKRKCSSKENKVILKEVLEGSVLPHNSKVWTCKIKVPEILPPTFLKKCDIIDVDYRLQIKARPMGAHLDIVNDMPIIIGTVPLMQDIRLS